MALRAGLGIKAGDEGGWKQESIGYKYDSAGLEVGPGADR